MNYTSQYKQRLMTTAGKMCNHSLGQPAVLLCSALKRSKGINCVHWFVALEKWTRWYLYTLVVSQASQLTACVCAGVFVCVVIKVWAEQVVYVWDHPVWLSQQCAARPDSNPSSGDYYHSHRDKCSSSESGLLLCTSLCGLTKSQMCYVFVFM